MKDKLIKFFLRHMILFIGAALIIVLTKQMAALGFIMFLLYAGGAWLPFLIINIVTFILCKAGSDKENDKLRIVSLILSFFGGVMGICLAKWFGFYTDIPEREKNLLRYSAELNIFVLVVLPLCFIVTEMLLGPNYIDFRMYL